jgi:hypothetical protein
MRIYSILFFICLISIIALCGCDNSEHNTPPAVPTVPDAVNATPQSQPIKSYPIDKRFTLQQRQAIWREMKNLMMKIDREAKRAAPINPNAHGSEYMREIKLNNEIGDRIANRETNRFLRKNHLTQKEMNDIASEGEENNWQN